MVEDMIERVARRLWDHSFDRMPDPPWEQTSELQKRFNRMLAREVIVEIREPTNAMIAAASSNDCLSVWHEMIDAALAPATTGKPT